MFREYYGFKFDKMKGGDEDHRLSIEKEAEEDVNNKPAILSVNQELEKKYNQKKSFSRAFVCKSLYPSARVAKVS